MTVEDIDLEQEPNTEQQLLEFREFKSTQEPIIAGTRRVPTWKPAEAARHAWAARVAEYPVMQQVTRTDQLRLSYKPGGIVTVAGEVLIDLEEAARLKLQYMTDHLEGLPDHDVDSV